MNPASEVERTNLTAAPLDRPRLTHLLLHMFSPSGLVPNLPDDLEGVNSVAGLGNGGKYTKPGVLLSKNKSGRQQTMGPLRPEPGMEL